MGLWKELNEASLVVYLKSCPNCGSAISDSRLLAGIPCSSCIPRPYLGLLSSEPTYSIMRKLGTLRRYEELERADRAFQELVDLFRKAVGSEPWGIQRLWLRRLSRGTSFAMLAPTGVGKTTLGIVAAIYFAMKGGRSYVVVPTTLLVRQVEKLLEVYSTRIGFTFISLAIHSRLSKAERVRREEALESGSFDILVTTSRYLMKNFERMRKLRFNYVFVDDVDAVMRGSRAIDMILQLMGFSERAISLGLELVKLRRELAYRGFREELVSNLRKLEEELRKEVKGVSSILVISSATGNPRGVRSRLFRELLGFEIGARPELIRNVYDLYVTPSRSIEEEVLRVVRALGRGGMVYVPVDRGIEYANNLAEFLRSSGVRAEAVHSKKAGALDKFTSGEVDVLVGVATYYGVLVRGIDLPEHIRYAVFAGIPRHKVGLQVEEIDVTDVLRLLPLLVEVVEDESTRDLLETALVKLRRAIRRAGSIVVEHLREVARGERVPETSVERAFTEVLAKVRELVRRGDVVEKLTKLPEVAVVEDRGRLYVLIPDAPTYIQASGRTSRLYLGGISKGISVVVVDDPRLLRGLERRLSWVIEDFKFSSYVDIEGKLGEVLAEVDRDRELIRLIREGDITKEELAKLRGLEFKTSLLVVESPNKARTIAKFFGRPSVKEYRRLRVYEVSLGNQTILITATGGHVYELVTGELQLPAETSGEWVDIYGIVVRDGKHVPVYTSIKRCLSCGRQFTEEPNEGKLCPYCSSPNVVDSIDVIEAIREVAREVDEVLVGTDPDTEGEKIAYDIVNSVRPYNAEVKRIEFHEVTKRALLSAIANPRGVNVDLVKAQLVRRVEDRWIGFSLSRLLQEDFWRLFCIEVVPSHTNASYERYRALCGEHPSSYRNLSAGRVQTPVLGWIIEAAERYKKTRRRYLSVAVEGLDAELVFELPREMNGVRVSDIEQVEVEVYEKVKEDVRLRPEPPFTTDAALSELSTRFGIPVSRVMEVLQDLFEAGFITYHRTDSTRVSDVGIRVAEEYLKQVEGEGYRELFVRRTWGEGGAHEAIRPTRPIDADTLRRLVEEGIIEPVIKLRKEHFLVYDAIFRRFIASQMVDAEVAVERLRCRANVKLKDGRVFELESAPLTLYVEARREGFLKYDRRFKLRRSLGTGRYPATRFRLFYRSNQPPHTEATLVRRMREVGIGRPSTYSKIVETILKRRYAIRTRGTGYLIPMPLGIEVYRYLTSRFQELVSEERTRELEQKMDMVEQGLKEYSEVVAELYRDLSELGLVSYGGPKYGNSSSL